MEHQNAASNSGETEFKQKSGHSASQRGVAVWKHAVFAMDDVV